MKYTFAICDDDDNQVDIIEGYIKRILCNDAITIKAHCAEELLTKIKNIKVDAFFLDIEMPDINGLKLSNILRKICNEAIIVFITGYKDFALNAFEVRALDYVIKPLTFKKFNHTFSYILSNLEKQNTKKEDGILIIKTQNWVRKINYTDIYYFEKYLRKIYIHHTEGTIEYYEAFKNLIQQLDMDYFVQCHKSYIINRDKISCYKENQVIINDINVGIPVGRAYALRVKNCFEDNVFKEV